MTALTPLCKVRHIRSFIAVPEFPSPAMSAHAKLVADCLKLFVDSFGPEVVARIAVVFTRAGSRTPEEAKQRATAIACVLRRLTGVPVDTFPVFQIDAGVASDARYSAAYIAERKDKNHRNLDSLAMWVRTHSYFDCRLQSWRVR